MLLSLKNMSKYSIEAKDGAIGHIDSFLFDEDKMNIRYIVVDTGKIIPGRKVLITPSAVTEIEPVSGLLSLEITTEQVKNSPDLDTHKPISRQQEIELHKYYNWVPYWGGTFEPINTPRMTPEETQAILAEQNQDEEAPNFRSTREVRGYKIHSSDDELFGHIDDFIVQADKWVVRYIVADTRNILPGKQVLVAPDWIRNIDWAESRVDVDVSKEKIEGCPVFYPSTPVNREYEIQLYDYYGRPAYWL